MPLTVEQQAEVDRASALLTGLSDEDKREVVRLAYVNQGLPVEQAVAKYKDVLTAIQDRLETVEALATRVGAVLETPDSVASDTRDLVDKYNKATVQTELDLLP